MIWAEMVSEHFDMSIGKVRAVSYELVIRNALVAMPSGLENVDIGIRGETIAQIGGPMTGASELDADGHLVLPGGVDVHVHLTSPRAQTNGPSWVDDFTSGSAAALAGGITTVGNMTFLRSGELPLEALERESELVRRQALADVILHPVLGEITPEVLDQIPALLAEGHNSIKFFMSMPGFDRQVGGFLEATERAAAAGLITMIHCEDHAMIERATQQLVSSGRESLRHYPESRPVISEEVATQRAVAFSAFADAPVYVVHLSSQAALDACRQGQRGGLPIYVETRPLYLHLTRERFEQEDGAKYVGQPPLRDQRDVDDIWAGLQQGAVHTVCTDHAPWHLSAKLDPDLSVAKLRPGVENLETQLPMLYSEGVRTGRLSLERFVEATSTNAAKLFGLYPRKGCIAIGSDADLILFDPNLTRTVGAPRHSNCDYSVYEGWEVTGWPITTLRRGQIVYDQGNVVAEPGGGMLVPRQATRLL
jgi:dihydropyrimidinase